MENPVAQRFAENLRNIRGAMGQKELAERVTALGIPMRLNTISRLENGQRVADVPELLALAVALGVSPSRLLLTERADDDTRVALTPTFATSARAAWLWAAGDRRLPENGVEVIGDVKFPLANRPHDPPDMTVTSEIESYGDELGAIHDELAQAAAARGVPLRVVLAYLRLEARRASMAAERERRGSS